MLSRTAKGNSAVESFLRMSMKTGDRGCGDLIERLQAGALAHRRPQKRRGCPDEDRLRLLLPGQAEPEEAEKLLTHAAECDWCGTVLREAAQDLTEPPTGEEEELAGKARLAVIRVASKRNCPKHRGKRLQKSGKAVEKVIVDLNFAKTGCRKMVIKYSGEKRYCPLCKRSYEPPSIQRLGGQTFGHGFRAWAVYQRIVLRLPYRPTTQAMEELFH